MAVALGAVGRDGNTDGFLDAAARHAFLLRRCRDCGAVGGPQEEQCAACRSLATEPMEASGRATLVSWTVVHGRRPDGTSGPSAVVAIGQLEEGPWWWTQVLGAEGADLHAGMDLRIDFEPAGAGETLPVFRPA